MPECAQALFSREELLEIAPHYSSNWNYGNAIYRGHEILGQIALREGNIAQARKELLAAGKTPGSPQLNSFGPDLTLARLLLEEGESEAVLAFADDIARFWTNQAAITALRTAAKAKK